jgi:hypothetical protein
MSACGHERSTFFGKPQPCATPGCADGVVGRCLVQETLGMDNRYRRFEFPRHRGSQGEWFWGAPEMSRLERVDDQPAAAPPDEQPTE